jgi:Asp-tRNA(Asn)/Glu-tRNA(Gln) amidotransferase A subunit family amidase
LADFKPTRDAVAMAQLKDAGAIVFGKNNLVEMSYGLTGKSRFVRAPYAELLAEMARHWLNVLAVDRTRGARTDTRR